MMTGNNWFSGTRACKRGKFIFQVYKPRHRKEGEHVLGLKNLI